MLIYVKFEIPKTPREFIKKLFSHTALADRITCVETYSDSECKTVQCLAGKVRSFDEIFFCTKTYFKDITTKEVLHILLTLDVGTFYPYFKKCGNINRINMLYYFRNINTNAIFCDAYGQYKSLWSWKQLFALLDIDSCGKMDKYILQNKNEEKIIKEWKEEKIQ